MNRLILVRYGEHTDGHLSEEGKQTMVLVSEKLKPFVQNEKVCIICAKVPRAIESAEVISTSLNVSPVRSFEELYAAEEDGVSIDLETANKVMNEAGAECDIVIAVVSREYIEALPNYILQSLGVQKTGETRLERGEVLVLDYDKKDITK